MDIVFYTRGLQFDGGTLAERSLGGAETALASLARELAARGHRVRVFCPCGRPGEYDGVKYSDLADFPKFARQGDCDVFVCSRFIDGLTAPLPARRYILWNHDILIEKAAPAIQSLMYRIDALFCLSQFQKEQYAGLLDIPEERFVVTRNGVDLGLVEECTKDIAREEDRLIYTSRPERGLQALLEMWPRLRERRPDLKLGVAWYENAGPDRRMEGLLAELKSQIDGLEGVEFLGNLTKRELYREMARAQVWVYPTGFPEISCIGAMEAAACGTPAVTTKYCALKETVADKETGVLVGGEPGSERYAREFVAAVEVLLEDKGRWSRMSRAGKARAADRFGWRQIAAEWEAEFERQLRSKASRVECPKKGSPGATPAFDSAFSTGGARLRQSVSCCMIVKDAEGTLHRCLKSVRPYVDELIVCDTGSQDSTREIAAQYADVVKEIPWNDDFGEARNRSIQGAKSDWILWIDADEYLVGGEHLAKYLRDNIYNGYIIRQHHQALDAEFKPDVPVRLFRNGRGVKFYGVIHEHPEDALNRGVRPAVVLSDVHIVHDGYITEEVRRGRFLRNLPLLLKDREKYPSRRLGLVFLARDYIHLARYEAEKGGGRIGARGRRFLRKAAEIHRENFADPKDPLHAYSFPLYQTALALLGEGVEVAWHLGPGDGQNGQVHRWRFCNEEELWPVLQARAKALFGRPADRIAFED